MNESVLYTVRRLVDDGKGIIHGSTDAELTCCGIDMEHGDWEVVTNAFDGHVRCSQCLKNIRSLLPHEQPSASKREADTRLAVHYILGNILAKLNQKTVAVTDWLQSELPVDLSKKIGELRTGVEEASETEIHFDPGGCWYSVEIDAETWFPDAEHENDRMQYQNCVLELMDTYGDEDLLVDAPHSVCSVGLLVDRRMVIVADFFRLNAEYEMRNIRSASIIGVADALLEPSSKRMFYHYRDTKQISLRVDPRMYGTINPEFRETNSENDVSGPRAVLSLEDWHINEVYLQRIIDNAAREQDDESLGLEAGA